MAKPAAGGPVKLTASDVGITEDTIYIGGINMTSNTRSLGPAISGQTEKVLDSLFKYVNDTEGGVAGRKIKLVLCDDGGDVGRARACYEKLKKQVFAFAVTETWLTDIIHDQLAKDKVPWFTWAWFGSEWDDQNMFPCHANGIREANALSHWVAENLHPKKVGIMYLNVKEDIDATREAEKVLKTYGIDVVQKIAQEWDSPDESQHVLSMRAANPDHVLSFSWPAPVAKFFHDADNQNWGPPMGYSANHLIGDPDLGRVLGEYVKNRVYTITSWQIQAETPSDEMKLFRDVNNKYAGKEMAGFHWRYSVGHHISQSAWVCQRILNKALREVGPNPTRQAVVDYVESHRFDSGMDVTVDWPKGNHVWFPYTYTREFMYKYVNAPDGAWDAIRIKPDPVFKPWPEEANRSGPKPQLPLVKPWEPMRDPWAAK